MSTRHTQGPWEALPEEGDRAYIRVRGTRLGSRYKIANVLTPVYEGVHEREAEETRANASLIAAAPDLLEALKWTASALQSAARDGDAHELDVIRMEDGAEKKIAEILDMADAALGKAKRATA